MTAPLLLGLDKYAPYILGSYAAAVVVLGGLIVWMALRNAQVRRELQAIESQRSGATEKRET